MRNPVMSCLVALCCFSGLTSLSAEDSPVYAAGLKTIDGTAATLKEHAGKAILIVNVASECGYTPQYAGLETLYQKYKAQGLVVVGMPCNDFGGQEPGTEAEIKAFCATNYQVTFPLYGKVAILGDAKHALYAALTGPQAPEPGEVKWNFEKFLISRDGKIMARFPSGVEPDAAELATAIEAALAK